MTPRIVVIGAGISGLTLAWSLRQRFGNKITLTILEKSQRAGGWICSKLVDNFIFEQGPRSCRTKGTGSATLQLIEELGLRNEVIPASPSAQKRFIYRQNSLQALPTSLWEFFRSPLMHGLLLDLVKEYQKPLSNLDDESIQHFISRRLSPEIASRLFDPLTSGIYAGDIEKLSIKACFPFLWQLESEHGSLSKGLFKKLFNKKNKMEVSPFVKKMQKTPVFGLKEGMETLPKTLTKHLTNEIKFDSPIKSLKIYPDSIAIETKEDIILHADHVFLTVPAEAAAKILSYENKALSDQINNLKAASVAVINMGWKKNVLPCEGFGYLIPFKEKEDLLGVVWDSSVFPQQNSTFTETRLTAMLGGARRPDLMELSDKELLACVRLGLQKHLNIELPPDAFHISRAQNAIPQYEVGHLAKVDSIQKTMADWSSSRVKLIGSSWHGVSVNDCIAEAIAEAEILFRNHLH